MENGGNSKVNAIFEARLAESGRKKLSNLADGPTRERYIRDKYERRKFYDPAGYSIDSGQMAPQSSPDISNQSGRKPRPGAPSDIARQRVAIRQARMSNSTNSDASQPLAKAPVSAPVDFDLLDFGSATHTPVPVPSSSIAIDNDPFSAPATGTSTQTNIFDSTGGQVHVIPPPKTAPPLTTASNDDILALFGPTKQQQNQQQSGFGMHAMNHLVPGVVGSSNNSNMMMMNRMLPHPPNSHNGSSIAYNNNNQMNPMLQQQMMTMMQNNNMMNNSNQTQMMMNQQQMMMMQQQQQQQVQNFGHMNNLNEQNNSMTRIMDNNSNNMSTAMQGMKNMTIGNAMPKQPSSDDDGFGEPMGGGTTQNTDAFSSLNAFR